MVQASVVAGICRKCPALPVLLTQCTTAPRVLRTKTSWRVPSKSSLSFEAGAPFKRASCALPSSASSQLPAAHSFSESHSHGSGNRVCATGATGIATRCQTRISTGCLCSPHSVFRSPLSASEFDHRVLESETALAAFNTRLAVPKQIAFSVFSRVSHRSHSTTSTGRPKVFEEPVSGRVRSETDGDAASSHAQPDREAQPRSSSDSQVSGAPLVAPGFERSVGLWLLGCSGLIFGLVCWGGYTRLTRSGLSMTDWRFQGKKLPQTPEEWEVEFNRYKETPEYQQVHHGITLEEFQQIYFIEWFHRMFARATGLFFVGGTFGFAAAKALTSRMTLRLAGMGILGAAQGLVGWWMVKSGFSEPTTENKMPRVSPYRLAFHLVNAMALYSLVLWHALSLLYPATSAIAVAAAPTVGMAAVRAAMNKLRSRTWALGALIATTLCSGAFVAGNDAGHAYNTWPKMIDDWVPPEVYEVVKQPLKIFESTPVVQFDHRMLAYATLIGSSLLYFTGRRLPVPTEVKVALAALPSMVTLQLLLGITTLLFFVPTELGVLHQGGGMATLSALVYLCHTISRVSRSLPV
uniref:Cytochrome C oxidase assembly factor COX15,putative n=15 Tax=Toxoplasma gondii TaxID=5811 RepID=A0A0F7V558_TOXGV|nr:TPA: cytochrome C oxidase assembly factor COX15,putative [Toxoplasma gondii VEG]